MTERSSTDSVIDFANYPANEVENPDCDSSDVFLPIYRVNEGIPTFDLGSLGSLNAGDLVEVSWEGNNPECTGELISLALKDAVGPGFDPLDNQELLNPYAGTLLTGEVEFLSFILPKTTEENGCHYQLDAVLGRPLYVVGPDGNYYSSAFGNPVPGFRSDHRSMLLDANNGTQNNCEVMPPPSTTIVVPTTTTTEAAPTTTVVTALSQSPTSVVPTTVELTCTDYANQAVYNILIGDSRYTQQLDNDNDGIACETAVPSTRTEMPVTGYDPGTVAIAGILLASVGAAMVLRWRNRNQVKVLDNN